MTPTLGYVAGSAFVATATPAVAPVAVLRPYAGDSGRDGVAEVHDQHAPPLPWEWNPYLERCSCRSHHVRYSLKWIGLWC